jgi:hypothetical protein
MRLGDYYGGSVGIHKPADILSYQPDQPLYSNTANHSPSKSNLVDSTSPQTFSASGSS